MEHLPEYLGTGGGRLNWIIWPKHSSSHPIQCPHTSWKWYIHVECCDLGEREPQGWSASLFYLTRKILIENNKNLHMHETFWGCTLSKKMLLSFALGHFPPNLWPLSMMYLLCTWNQENVATNQWKILQLTSALNLATQPPICGRLFLQPLKKITFSLKVDWLIIPIWRSQIFESFQAFMNCVSKLPLLELRVR